MLAQQLCSLPAAQGARARARSGRCTSARAHTPGGRRRRARPAVRAPAGSARCPPPALLAADGASSSKVCRTSPHGRSSYPARRGLVLASCGARRWTRASAASCCAARRESATKSCRTSRRRASRASKVSRRELGLRVGKMAVWTAGSCQCTVAAARIWQAEANLERNSLRAGRAALAAKRCKKPQRIAQRIAPKSRSESLSESLQKAAANR